METEIDYKEKYEKCDKFCRSLLDDITIFQSAIKLLKSELEKAKHVINEKELGLKKLKEVVVYLITENYVQVIPNDNNSQQNNNKDENKDEETNTDNSEE